jgi:hypothetical protein
MSGNKFLLAFFLLIAALVPSLAWTQGVPQQVNYQAVLRSSTGSVIPNKSIIVRLGILVGR